MPSIVINEKDLTKTGGSAAGTDIAYVPGFMSTAEDAWKDLDKRDAAPARTPVLCETIQQFERYFGRIPAKMSADVDYGEGGVSVDEALLNSGATSATKFCKSDDYEKSYIYAKELINQGIPVLYESVNSVVDETSKAIEVSPDTMYNALGSDMYSRLVDKGEYDFKFITSGGYPTLEVCGEEVEFVAEVNRGDSTIGVDAAKFAATCATVGGLVVTGRYTATVSLKATKNTQTLQFSVSNESGDQASTFAINAAADNGLNLSNDGKDVRVGDTIAFTLDSTQTGDVTEYSVSSVVFTPAKGTISIDDKAYLDKAFGQTKTLADLIVSGYSVEDLEGIYAQTFTCSVVDKKTGELDWLNADNKSASSVGITVEDYTPVEGDVFEVYIDSSMGLAGGIVTKMIDLASQRGDCVALIDHLNLPSRNLVGSKSVYEVYKKLGAGANSEFAAAFTPWVNIDCAMMTDKDAITQEMPASLAYLMALGKSNKTNANWLAIAGATRGQVPGLNSSKPLNINKVLTNSIAENEYQNRNSVSINAITKINPFGYRIWGNRTLLNNGEGNVKATSFLNTRNMVSDVKKVVYAACKKYMFEQNNDILWTNFKSEIEPTLNNMKTGAGISSYKILKGTTTEKAKLVAKIVLYPLYAVEDFEIMVEMSDEEIAVS